MKFKDGELVILNENIKNGLPNRVGELAKIYCEHVSSTNYDYTVVLDNGDLIPVKESELNKLTEKEKELSKFIFKGGRAIHYPTSEEVCIQKVDYLLSKAEADFVSGGSTVVDFWTLRKLEKETNSVTEQLDKAGKFTEIALEIGQFTDEKNKQYGSSVDATYEMVKVLIERYTYDEENYLMPKSLLKHILLQVRMMDKINRVFNNPSGEGDSESPYNDLAGYSLIGIDMVAAK